MLEKSGNHFFLRHFVDLHANVPSHVPQQDALKPAPSLLFLRIIHLVICEEGTPDAKQKTYIFQAITRNNFLYVPTNVPSKASYRSNLLCLKLVNFGKD